MCDNVAYWQFLEHRFVDRAEVVIGINAQFKNPT